MSTYAPSDTATLLSLVATLQASLQESEDLLSQRGNDLELAAQLGQALLRKHDAVVERAKRIEEDMQKNRTSFQKKEDEHVRREANDRAKIERLEELLAQMERNAHDEAANEITSLDIVSATVSPSDGGGFDTEAEFAQQMATFEHLLLESKEREEKLAKKLKSLQQKYDADVYSSSMLDDQNKKVRKLEVENSALHSQVTSLQTESENLKDLAKGTDEVVEMLAQLQRKNENLNEELDAALSTIENLRDEVSHNREEYSTSFVPSVHQTPLQSYESVPDTRTDPFNLSPASKRQAPAPTSLSEELNPFTERSLSNNRIVASEPPPPRQSSRDHVNKGTSSGRTSRRSSANHDDPKAALMPHLTCHGFSVESASNETYEHTDLPARIAEDADDTTMDRQISPTAIAERHRISMTRERATSAPQTVAPSIISLAPTHSRSVSPQKRSRSSRRPNMGSISQLQSRLQLAAALSQPVLAVRMSTTLLTNLAILRGRIESIHGRIVQSTPNLLNRRLRKAFDSEGLTTLSNSLLENVEDDIVALSTLFQWQDEEEKLVCHSLVACIITFLRESIKYRMVHNEVERAFVRKLQEAAKTEVDRANPVEESRRSPWLSLSRLGRSQNNMRSDSDSRQSSNSPSDSRLSKSASVPVLLHTPRNTKRTSQNIMANSHTPIPDSERLDTPQSATASRENAMRSPTSPSLRNRERILGNSRWDSEDELGRTACTIM